MPKTSHLEQNFLDAIATYAPELPIPEREFVFACPRRWRADFAWTSQRVLVEIEGIYGAKSRHRTAAGYHNDCEKYRAATVRGYAVLRYTSRDLATEAGRENAAMEVAAFVKERGIFR